MSNTAIFMNTGAELFSPEPAKFCIDHLQVLASTAQESLAMFFTRRRTDRALQHERDAQRAPTLPRDIQTGRIQEKFACYNEFPWADIEKFLKRKWPHWTNFNPTRVCWPIMLDRWR